MNEVNKTLYIPLYGKSYVSKKGIILNDKKAKKYYLESDDYKMLAGDVRSLNWLKSIPAKKARYCCYNDCSLSKR